MKTTKTHFNVLGQLAALRRYAYSLVRNRDEAEDLVQDTLVRALEKKSTFRPEGNLRNWLLSILHNTHIDRLRVVRSKEGREAAFAEISEASAPAGQEHATRLSQIRQAFLTLPTEQREALHLVVIEALTYQEAADALGIPIGTLMSRLSRARQRLRSLEAGGDTDALPHLRIVGGKSDEPN